MLRFTFILGYSILLMSLIGVVAIKVIALGQNASWGESPMVDYARVVESWFMNPAAIPWIVVALIAFITLWIVTLRRLMKKSAQWEKTWVKTLIIGCSIMMCFFLILALVGLTANLTSGLVQETASRVAGMMSSPVLMEASLFFIGLTLLFTYNIFRRKIDGEDFVEIEISESLEKSLKKRSK